MTAVICLGGPLHGRFVDPGGYSNITAAQGDPRLIARYHDLVAERNRLIAAGADPSELAEPEPPVARNTTYHLRSIQIVGWRVVLNCLTTWEPDATAPDGCVMPGYVHGVPVECEPDRNARPAICRCALMNLAASMRLMTGRGRSSCHLDHCPVHGPFRAKEAKHGHGR